MSLNQFLSGSNKKFISLVCTGLDIRYRERYRKREREKDKETETESVCERERQRDRDRDRDRLVDFRLEKKKKTNL